MRQPVPSLQSPAAADASRCRPRVGSAFVIELVVDRLLLDERQNVRRHGVDHVGGRRAAGRIALAAGRQLLLEPTRN